MKIGNGFKQIKTFLTTNRFILNQVKQNKSTIYGAQSIKKQIGIFGRPTSDFDILSKQPKKSARQLEKTLDKASGADIYFTKPAIHPGTYKVKHKGADMKKNTADDIEIADFTKPTRKFKTVNIEGIKYVRLSEVIKDKRKSLADQEFSFRHAKDKEDIERIKMARRRY